MTKIQQCGFRQYIVQDPINQQGYSLCIEQIDRIMRPCYDSICIQITQL